MRKKIVLAFAFTVTIFILTASYSALARQYRGPREAMITITYPHHPDQKPFVIRLKHDSKGILCAPPKLPPRHIHVHGLKNLEPPMKSSPILDSCEQVLTWEDLFSSKKSTVCYRFGASQILDDTLRWCTSG